MLNPETVVMRRIAGIRSRETLKGLVNTNKSSDNPLLFTGSGNTILELDLLFDVTILGSSIETEDVRELTKPIWDLAENNQRSDRFFRPAICRFIWGKSWNFPGVVSEIAERLEYFSPQGIPRRSWMRLRLLRMLSQPGSQLENDEWMALNQEVNAISEFSETELQLPDIDLSPSDMDEPEVELQNSIEGSRIDYSAYRLTGDPTRWRDIAASLNLLDPLHWIESQIPDQQDLSKIEE